ncbi:MAG: 30S ribosomal protein S24e [Thermoplasmata archaeon]|nr:30S ribosomal protein S24e [Thermoplasmata archaeon]
MELKILEERPNPLLKRVEYRFEIGHGLAATPTRDTVRVEFAKLVKVPKDRVIIERMNARYGMAKSEGVAVTYQSVEIAKSIVREHILVRNGLKEKAVKAAPGAAAEAAPPPEPAAKKESAPKKDA